MSAFDDLLVCGLMDPADREEPPESTGDEQDPDYRFTLANERTFLAWIRTALALIAGGVAVVQLVPAFGIPGVRQALGVVLTGGGGLLAALAVRRWQTVQTAMRRGADLPPTRLPLLLGGAILLVAILVLVVLLAQPAGR
jgi:putative membrane protein